MPPKCKKCGGYHLSFDCTEQTIEQIKQEVEEETQYENLMDGDER